jgi:hypothetical protein
LPFSQIKGNEKLSDKQGSKIISSRYVMYRGLLLIFVLLFSPSSCKSKSGSGIRNADSEGFCPGLFALGADGKFDTTPCVAVEEKSETKPGDETKVPAVKHVNPTSRQAWTAETKPGSMASTGTLSKIGSDHFKMTGDFFLTVLAPGGYDAGKVTLDHSKAESQKYLMTDSDWKNVEITGYFKISQYKNSNGKITIKARTGPDMPNKGTPPSCVSTGYQMTLSFGGLSTFIKRQWGSKQTARPQKHPSLPLKDKWTGVKFVVKNIDHNGVVVPQLELWLDSAANGTWKLADSTSDRGGWGEWGQACHTDSDAPITWGGPVITLSVDGVTEGEMKNLTVQEIQGL